MKLTPDFYRRDGERCAELVKRYVQEHPDVKLRFKDWGTTCYMGSLDGARLAYLCASQDAVDLCEWVQEQMQGRATLLMMYAVVQQLGLQPRGTTICLTTHRLG